MADVVSSAQRSYVMSRVRSRDTAPEMQVRRIVWGAGFRYRLHVRKLPGVPDLTFPRYRLAVFVHGCFWHQHSCRRSKRPSSNKGYWNSKLDANMARDARNISELEAIHWTAATLWECSLASDVEWLLTLLRNLRTGEGLA